MKTVIVMGTRPEVIKLAPVVHALRNRGLPHKVYLSGQHKELLSGLLKIFDIDEYQQLDIDYRQPNLSQLTARVLEAIDEQIPEITEKSLVIVQGDTTTAMATALACFYKRIPIGHVEAGLRTHNLQNPFPEELNRQIISKVSCYHFCPTAKASENLRKEGFSETNNFICGNTVVDALKYVRTKKIPKNYFNEELPLEAPELEKALRTYSAMEGSHLGLLTLHRRENQSEAEPLLNEIRFLCQENPLVHLVYPYHLNPQVKELAFRHLSRIPNLHLIPPLSYRPMIYLMENTDFALSDSGGLQEELPSFRKPLLILRQTTERPEVIERGLAKLVGINPKSVRNNFLQLLEYKRDHRALDWYQPEQPNPYGEGDSAEKIVQVIERHSLQRDAA